MAEPLAAIFNKKASDKLRNPDDLERCVQVTNPSVWAVLTACAVLLAGLLAWGVFGAVTTSVTATGTVVDGRAMCFLSADDVAKVHVGDTTNFGGEQMTVSDIAAVPLSVDEVRGVLGSDYLAATLVSDDWGYQVIFDGDSLGFAQDVPQTVSITVERIAPISLVLKGRD